MHEIYFTEEELKALQSALIFAITNGLKALLPEDKVAARDIFLLQNIYKKISVETGF